MRFSKPAEETPSLINLLKSRGLIVNDENKLAKYLEHIGYYRLTGYMYPFQSADGKHMFRDGTSFDLILDHYLFDKDLRLIILDVLERIEISVRSCISNTMSLSYKDPFWYLIDEYFKNKNLHQKMILEIREHCKESKEIFIKNYYHKYSEQDLPSWMVIETISFGRVASLFENLKASPQKNSIAKHYNVQYSILESWLKSLNFIRNCCAHHSRLWNRAIPIKPLIPRRKKNAFLLHIEENTDKKLYGILSCILHLLQSINPNSTFKSKLKELFQKYSDVNIGYMGFPANYQEEELWH